MSTTTRTTTAHFVDVPAKTTSGAVDRPAAKSAEPVNSPDTPIVESKPVMPGQAYLDELNWLKEEVEVTLLHSSDPTDVINRIIVTINGRSYPFLRGRSRKCPRFVLEHLATAKRESVHFTVSKNHKGDAQNHTQRVPYLKHPHTYVTLTSSAADSAKEAKWYNDCLNRTF